MPRWSWKDEGPIDNTSGSTPGTPDTRQVQDSLAALSLSTDDSASKKEKEQENTKPNESPQSNQQEKPKDTSAPNSEDSDSDPDFQPRPHRYKIHTLRQGSDEPDRFISDDDEEGAADEDGSRDVDPDELLKHLFTFDAPREIDLKVKIKGDFCVTVLL
ncbi:uncharacterized protein BDV14DRAFT_168897, partial [Aspergillus stella-maris]|uniref:uncharacterized protein n=1 Tax=Aspergillus stella-maris TaxID=1810926 RepID=UPI003CCDB89C